MANIPVVSGTEVATPSSGVKMDSGAFREAALAPGKVAAAIGQDVGGVFADVAFKIQANRNARMVFDADLAMRKTKDDFTAELHKMPDETTWLPAYKERVNALREQINSNPHAGPDVRNMLTQKLDMWEATTTAEVRQAALLKGAKETRESAISDATYAATHGDLEGAHNALQAAVANYAMTDADAKKIGARFPSMAAQAQADTAIATDPINAPEAIKKFAGVIEPRVFIGVMAHANEARSRAQSANVNELAMQMDESPDGTIDPDLLKEKVQSGQITQRAADGLIARMKRQDVEKAKDDFIVASGEAYDHKWTEDKTPEQTAARFKEENAHLPTALRTRLFKEIDAHMAAAKKEGEKEQRPVETQMMEMIREDRERNHTTVPVVPEAIPAKSGFFGFGAKPASTTYHTIDGGLTTLRKMTEDDFKKLYGDKFTKKQVMDAEQLHYATIQSKMREWFKDPANKDATLEQANQYRLELEKPFVMGSVESAIMSSPQATPEIDSLLKKYGQ